MGPSVAQVERQNLAELARRVGADAKTLCEGWTTKDLLAHMVIREGRIDAAPGILIPAFSHYTAKVQNKVAQQPFETIVEKFASGPPTFSLFKLIDAQANVIEFFVHYEDINRGEDPNARRVLSDELVHKIKKIAPSFTKRLLSKTPVTLVLKDTQGNIVQRIEKNTPEVTVQGEVGELLLWAFGRKPVDVTFTGNEQDIKKASAFSKGF